MLWSKINSVLQFIYWTGIYLLEFTDRNTRWVCEICWKLVMKTPDWCHWCSSSVLFVNFEHFSHLALVFLVFLLLTLNRWKASWVVKATFPKKPWYSSFVVCKKRLIYCSQRRTWGASKVDPFAKIVCSLKSLTILYRSSNFKIYYRVLNLSWVFFQIYI